MAKYKFMVKIAQFKTANAIWRLKFEKSSKVVLVYLIRIQQFEKVYTTEFHINPQIA